METSAAGVPPDDRDRRARAEEALYSGELIYRLVVDTVPALISTMTPEGEVEYVNRQVYEYFGLTLDELKKWGTADAVHPDDLPRVIDAWRSAVATGLVYEIEHRMRRADGVYRWFQVRGVPLRDDDGRIVRWCNLMTDIDERKESEVQRKHAEEEVRRSETFLAEAQALSQTGSWGWNTATGDLFWSRETHRIFGFEPDINPTLSMVAEAIHPDDRARFEHDAETLARDHTDFEREYRLKLRDGSVKHVHVVGRFAARAFPDLDFIGSIMDVTERKQAADALLKAQVELAEVTRRTTMGELAASIAHEINQPLATVVTNAQTCANLLRAQPPSWGEVEGAVSDIAAAGKRASDVIARIRLLLRKGVSEPVELSVNDVIRDVIALTRETTRQKRVMLDTKLTYDVPSVLADRVQLQQVLINLITNAADAMSDIIDRPRTLIISSNFNNELQVEVAVADAGVGIDPKYRDRIFDPFFTTKADGMGMGLAICRGIVEACGGRLWATANPDFGTTVRIALPAAVTEGA